MTGLIAVGLTVVLVAQEPMPGASAPKPDAQPASVVPATAAVIPLGTRVGELPTAYEDGRRRDPFVSLVAPKRTATAAAADPGRARTGLATLALADVTVRGVVRSEKAMFAILEAPSKQSFVARVRDHLMDGVVQSIDATGVVFTEQADGGGPPTQVRKSLRPPGEDVR